MFDYNYIMIHVLVLVDTLPHEVKRHVHAYGDTYKHIVRKQLSLPRITQKTKTKKPAVAVVVYLCGNAHNCIVCG